MLSVAPILGVNDVQATVDWFVESLGFSTVNVFGMPADEGPV
jgi:catechol 2,3-dioxygenase-like lactoylglutathione lyase family enzyme